MKLRIFGRPALAVGLLGLAALLLVAATLVIGWPYGLILLPIALFYLVLFGLALRAFSRLETLERWVDWTEPQRLLILSPHEDDCVISSGGIGPSSHRSSTVRTRSATRQPSCSCRLSQYRLPSCG